jgi:polyisoprenoid-binding protein YceI
LESAPEAVIPRAVLLALAIAASPALADDCRAVDASHGKVEFEVMQAGAPFRGSFSRFGGTVCASGVRASRIDVWLDPASVDAGLPEIDAALKGEDFFAVQRHPRIAYASSSVEERGSAQLAHGVLQIKGARRSLDVPFEMTRREDGELVLSGALTLNRLQYGIGAGEWSDTKWLGAQVKVTFSVRLPPAAASAQGRNPAAD